MSLAIFPPHFVTRIFSSAFYHPHFSIRSLSSAIFHPHFIIRIFLSAIRRHPVRTLQRPLDELTSQRSSRKCSLLLFFKFGQIALTFLVVIWLVLVQDSIVIKTVNEDLRLSSSPSIPSICGRMYRKEVIRTMATVNL